MPSVYVRKSNKGAWSQQDLLSAINGIQHGLSIRSVSRQYEIPEATIRHRLRRNDFEKQSMGPESQLGGDTENELAVHIKKLQSDGVSPTQQDVRNMAYDLAETLGKKHTFNKEKKMAGRDWFASFMRRHPELSVRKSQRSKGAATVKEVNRDEVKKYFALLYAPKENTERLDSPGIPSTSTTPNPISTPCTPGGDTVALLSEEIDCKPSTSTAPLDASFPTSPSIAKIEVIEEELVTVAKMEEIEEELVTVAKMEEIEEELVTVESLPKIYCKPSTSTAPLDDLPANPPIASQIVIENMKGIEQELVTVKSLPKEKKTRRLRHWSPPSTSSDEDNQEMVLLSDTVSETNDEACVECNSITTSRSDWMIKCISCGQWLHQSCSVYEQKCIDCGRNEIRQRNSKKNIPNVIYLDENKDSNESMQYASDDNPLQTTSQSMQPIQFIQIQPAPTIPTISNMSTSQTSDEEDSPSANRRIASVLEEVVALQREEKSDDPMGNKKFLLSLLPFMQKLPDDVNLEVRLQLMSVIQTYSNGDKSFC